MPAHDVFISYPSADKVAADGVCHGLEARGIRCWLAPRDVIPGSDWQTSLLDAISDARVVVLLFTGNTNNSDHIKREVTAAFEGGSVVIPFRLENVAPQGSLRYHLTGVHWLDAFSKPMDEHIEQLAHTIKRVLEKPASGVSTAVTADLGGARVEPPPAPQPAEPILAKPAAPPPPAPPPKPAPQPVPPRPATGVAPPPAPQPTPMRTAVPPAKRGGINPLVLVGGGVAALVLIVLVVLALAGGDDTQAGVAADGSDPAAAAAAEALRQQGVQIGVEPRPEQPVAESTPVPTLDEPVEAPSAEPVYEEPVLDDGGAYVEEPVAVDEGGPKFE